MMEHEPGVQGWRFLVTLLRKIQSDDCLGLAAEMAYNIMLSFIPGLVFIIGLVSLLALQQDWDAQILAVVSRMLPEEGYRLIEKSLYEVLAANPGGFALLGLLTALWTASNGARTLIKAVNRAYGIQETRPFWRVRLLAMALVGVFGVSLVVGSNLILFGDALIHWAGEQGVLSKAVWRSLEGLPTLLVFLLLTLLGLGLYRACPDKGALPRSQRPLIFWPGAVVFALLWLGFSAGFRFYVEHLARYNQVYGTLGTMMGLLVWLYWTSLVVLVGGEVNAVLRVWQIRSRPLQ